MAWKFGCWDNEADYLKACRAEDEWDAKGPWDDEIDDYEDEEEEEDEEVSALKCYWLMNHEPTEEQMKELERLGMDVLVSPNGELKKLWANVPTDEELPIDLEKKIRSFFFDMDEDSSDFAVVQGEMTATYAVVSWLQRCGIRVYSAVTERVSKEVVNDDGTVTKTSEFKHVRFREYKQFRRRQGYDKK